MWYASHDGCAYRTETEVRSRYENEVRFGGYDKAYEEYVGEFARIPVAYTVDTNEYGDEEWEHTSLYFTTKEGAYRFARELELANEIDIMVGLCCNNEYRTQIREVKA